MKDETVPVRSPYHKFILSQPKEAKRVQSLVESGRRLLESGQNDEARRLFIQALSVYPLTIPALNNLAFIALREGDTGRALDVVHEVLDCDPNDPIAHGLAAQCWFYRESEPMVCYHVDRSLSSYITLVNEGDPADPMYAERAFPFVFQALLMAEDDQGITALYTAVPDRPWTTLELTWIGIATLNRGRINEAHLIWRRANKLSRYEPALVYATMAQHILSEELLPFGLDYELLTPDDEDFSPYTSSSLTLATFVNEVFRRPSKEAQTLIASLVENELPAQDYFLRRLLQNETLAPGVRMTAAVHLVWLGDDELLAENVRKSFDPKLLSAEDLPVYYLLGATLAQLTESPGSPIIEQLVETGRIAAKEGAITWVAECLEELFDDTSFEGHFDLDDDFDSFDDDIEWDGTADLFPAFSTDFTEEPDDPTDASDPTSNEPRKLKSKRNHSNIRKP